VNYFLDFGTHYFESNGCPNGLLAHERNGLFGSEQPYDWIVKTFEGSKQIYEINKLHTPRIAKKFKGFEDYNAAVLDHDGKVSFRYSVTNQAGSNCLTHDFTEVSNYKVNEVPCADAKRIVQEVIKNDPEARIIIKCDIEGSEFKVLPRILEIENVEKYIIEIFIEWHERFWEKDPSYTKILESKKSILNSMKTIIAHDWE